jgi:membrane-associated phospholipid phosphatase
LDQVLKARDFWPVDKVILSYLAAIAVLVLAFWNRLPDAWLFLAAHLIAAAVIVYQIKRPNPTTWVFRNWYPLLYVACCYKEMALLIPAVWRSNADQWLADLDYRIWKAHPTVWLERIHSPQLSEFLQVVYTLFIPAVLLVAALLWRRRQYAEFQYYAFLIALGFLVSYIGYLIVPARGPRFLLQPLQNFPLRGLWLFPHLQGALDRLESAHYDCFPSGHTEMSILAWWGSRMIARPLFRLYFLYTLGIIFATVYLRYHYSVDVLAGVAVAAILILSAPVLYNRLSKGARSFERH